MNFLLPLIFSFLATLFGILAILKFFPKLGLMDRPHEYGLTRKPVPYSGGLIFVAVFLSASFLFLDITPPLAGVIFAVLLLTVVNFADDRRRLSPWLRLIAQTLAAVIVIFAGIKIQLINTPFGAPLMLDGIIFTLAGQKIWLLSALAIIVWLVLIMNVMNWLDGIPGLASGVSAIAFGALFLLAIQKFHIVDQTTVIVLAGVLGASALVFAFFDFAPPRLLMGDTGSMFLGFMIGVLAIFSGGKLATALIVMGLPVIDAFFVIVRRIIHGKSPLRGDRTHFHHRLLQAGFSERQALLFNYAIVVFFAFIVLALHSALQKFFAFLGVLACMLLLGLFLHFRDRAAPR